jgi:hypothetical protein
MAPTRQQTSDPVTPATASRPPDWVDAYYTPATPANLPDAPHPEALEQMYAYYDG